MKLERNKEPYLRKLYICDCSNGLYIQKKGQGGRVKVRLPYRQYVRYRKYDWSIRFSKKRYPCF